MNDIQVPNDVLCTKSHEFVLEENGVLKVGITDYAVEQLGDIVFVELPEVDTEFEKGDIFATIESVKAASEVYMPVGGKIVEVNEEIISSPELVNTDTYDQGWFVKITGYNLDELAEGLEYDEYKEFVEED